MSRIEWKMFRTGVFMLLGVILIIKLVVLGAIVQPAKGIGLAPSGGEQKDFYLNIARSLANGHGYRVTPDSAETMVRNPGYVGFLAGLIMVFGDRMWPVQLGNVAFAMGTVVLAGLLARRFSEQSVVPLVAMIVTGLYPLGLLLESRAGVETMFTFLVLLSVLLTVRARDSGTTGGYVVAGLVIGVATLVRSAALFALPLIMIWLVGSRRPVTAYRRVACQALVMFAAAMAVVAPWMVRNYQLSGVPTFSESHLGIGAWQGWYATATMHESKAYQWRIEDASRLQREVAGAAGAQFRTAPAPIDTRWDIYPTIHDELLYSDALLDATLSRYRADPPLLLKHVLLNAWRFWFQGATNALTVAIICINGPLLLLGILGAAAAWRQRRPEVLLLLIPVVVLWGVHVPLIAHARYATPLAPLLAVLAGVAVANWPLPARFRRLADRMVPAESPRTAHEL